MDPGRTLGETKWEEEAASPVLGVRSGSGDMDLSSLWALGLYFCGPLSFIDLQFRLELSFAGQSPRVGAVSAGGTA